MLLTISILIVDSATGSGDMSDDNHTSTACGNATVDSQRRETVVTYNMAYPRASRKTPDIPIF